MSDLFIIGAAGTKSYRAALGAVSENIANANTEGYSRRIVKLREAAGGSGVSPLAKPASLFSGSEVGATIRNNDAYLDSATRFTGNMLGSAKARGRWMGDIETAINDTDLGVGQRLNEFFSSVQKLAANPGDTTLRTNMLFSIDQVATAFNQSATELGTIIQSVGETAQTEINAVNDAIANLAKINEGLRRTLPGTAAEAQLLDSRDNLLSDISSRIDIDINFADHGIAQLSYKGKSVLEALIPTKFEVTAASNGTLSLSHEGTPVAAPTGGTIGGLVTSASTARARLDNLDDLAEQFANDVNDWHAGGLRDPNDPASTGIPLLSFTTGAATLTKAAGVTTADIATWRNGVANGNLLAITDIRGTGGIEAGWTQLVTTHANLMTATKAELTSAENRNAETRARRDEVSGVDLDIEAADLLRYQQAYQAAARIIQVAREITNSILAIN